MLFQLLHSKISSLSQPMRTCQVPAESHTVVRNYRRQLQLATGTGHPFPYVLHTPVLSSPRD